MEILHLNYTIYDVCFPHVDKCRQKSSLHFIILMYNRNRKEKGNVRLTYNLASILIKRKE